MVDSTFQAEPFFAPILPDKEFQDFLASGRFMVQRSRSSGRYVFPPRIAEPKTGVRDLEWVQATGRGTLYSITFVAKRNPADEYNVALVDLEEGPRVLARINGATRETASIGMAVKARIVAEDEAGVLEFVPVLVPACMSDSMQRKDDVS